MRITTAAIIAAAAVSGLTATAAFAQTRLSDMQYVKLARCSGLAGEDSARFDALLKANKQGRDSYIADKAASARTTAAREARTAGEGGKASIAAELNGACAKFAS